jgi:Flp pilus assembly protein TadD
MWGAYCDLGVLLFRTGDTDNAVRQFLNAAKINPDDPTPLFNLAAIYQKSGRPDLAMKLSRECFNSTLETQTPVLPCKL